MAKRCSHHEWEPVGGCDSNPGVEDVGNGWMQYTKQCTRCGRMKRYRRCYLGIRDGKQHYEPKAEYFWPDEKERK